jgi:hypothetical protein
MKNPALDYYMHDGPAAFSFELAGILAADYVARLEQAWRTASSAIGSRSFVVDLTFVTRVDEAGAELLRTWHRNGAKLVANTSGARLLAESIIGAPLPAPARASAPTYEPFFTQHSPRAAMLLVVILIVMLFPVTAAAGAAPGCRQAPTRRQLVIGIYNTVRPVSPFTSALSEMQTVGSRNALTAVSKPTK